MKKKKRIDRNKKNFKNNKILEWIDYYFEDRTNFSKPTF